MRGKCILGLTLLALLNVHAPAGEPAAAAPAGVQILGNDSWLRAFLVFKTPVAIAADGKTSTLMDPPAKGSKETKPNPEFQSGLPSANWTSPEFDDVPWERWQAPIEVGPASDRAGSRLIATANSMICVRGRFMVQDPSRIQGLKLNLEFVGGVAVYVNGREVTRANLPAGELKPDTLAEKYPDDLYCEPDGQFLQDKMIQKSAASFERRYRKLTDVEIPAKLLRQGLNVLALEIHRAPVNAAVLEAKASAMPSMGGVRGIWAYVGLKGVSLVAAEDGGVAPAVSRPKGIQLWSCVPFETVTTFDYGDGGEVQPVTISSPRNGVFSGRLVVSSDQPIRNLKAAVTALAGDGGASIPASAVRIRCAEAAQPEKCWMPVHRFNGLLDVFPAEIPVVKASPPREEYPRNYGTYKYVPNGPINIKRTGAVSGAAAPIWLTVRVPRDARPGAYAGTVTVSADGLAPTPVPLRVIVGAWVMPDPKDFRIQNFAYLSEDAIARYYAVEPWSEKHFALMARSWALMAEVNSRQTIVNLAVNFYGGNKGAVDCSNEQTLIRWIKQADGSYKHDFSLFDKYLDFVAKTIGKPTQLRLNCWGEFLPGWGGAPTDPTECWKKVFAGKRVTCLDPATGKLEPMDQPIPGTPESLAFWKPVLDEVRKKIEARGWWDVTALGHNSYCTGAHATVVDMAKKIWPDGVWSYTAHNGPLGGIWRGTDKSVTMPVRYADAVWTRGWPKSRGYRALLKPRPSIWCYTFRTDMRDWSELSMLRSVPEEEILSGHDGVSDFGADLFPIKNERGRFDCLGNGRGTGGPNDSTRALLAPGPDGAIATERFEMLREGVQLGEAILLIQRALDEKKISGDLEQRANRLLDERDMAFMKHWYSGRFERDCRLIQLAGEVAAQSGK